MRKKQVVVVVAEESHRYKCTLKTGVRVERGHGTVPDPGGYSDVATSMHVPISNEQVKMEGRDAPSGS